jgi:hypothetical protein
VAVGLRPGRAPEGDDLRALLARPGEDKLYGTAPILAYRDAHPESRYRANAALSLQALLLESERRHVVAGTDEVEEKLDAHLCHRARVGFFGAARYQVARQADHQQARRALLGLAEPPAAATRSGTRSASAILGPYGS